MFSITRLPQISSFFFFNDTATTEIYTLSLHDALPILSFQILASNNCFATGRQCQIKWQALKSGYENIMNIERNRTRGRTIRPPNRYDRFFHQKMTDEFWIPSGNYLIQIYS